MGNTNITLPDGQRSATTDQVVEKIDQQVAAGPPVNVDVPYAEQHGEQLTCTMGNWDGEPRDYAYQWLRDDAAIAAAWGSTYALEPDDVGKSFACEVIASHSGGSTLVTSNSVVAEDPAAPA
jgi:hypothetical protein